MVCAAAYLAGVRRFAALLKPKLLESPLVHRPLPHQLATAVCGRSSGAVAVVVVTVPQHEVGVPLYPLEHQPREPPYRLGPTLDDDEAAVAALHDERLARQGALLRVDVDLEAELRVGEFSSPV